MAKEWAKAFYNSLAWKETRAAYRKRARGLCERCLAKGIITPGEIVHHVQELTPENIKDPSIALSFDNLQLVCRDCHAQIHQGTTDRRYTVTPDGRVLTG